MKYFRWLSLGAAMILCVCLFAPSNAPAASSPKKSGAHKVQVKKTSSKKANVSRDGHKNKKDAEKKGDKSKRKRSKGDTKVSPVADSERDVWIKRAQESEIFTGKASWFGKDFHNKPTASGLPYDMYTFTAAHRTLPLGTVVKVTDQKNGKSVMVCVTDRGPYIQGRIIDLSYAAAKRLDLSIRGVGKVNLEVVSDQNGMPIKPGLAYFVRYAAGNGKKKVGPFAGFADAAAMQEALIQAHPEAEVVLEKAARK